MYNYDEENLALEAMEPCSFDKLGEINQSENGFNNLWESELYYKSYFKSKKCFNYYDSSNISKYLFFGWVNKWSRYLSRSSMEPYKLHPLPISDQILYWQPIFSKHVSDGLVRLENYETSKSSSNKFSDPKLPYRSILFRAALLTFWKRTLFSLLGIILTNILSMSIAILVKRLLKFLNDKSIRFIKIFLLLLSVIILQVIDGLLIENFKFYMYRLIHLIQYSFSITTFQHGLCYRRKFYNNIEGSNSLNVCNNVLHSFSPDSECSKNPLYCPARRYQNKDITPNMFSFEYTDPFYISMFVESLFFIINFLSNFIYGILLMSFQIKVNMWVLYVLAICFVFLMILIEIVNTYVLKTIFIVRDYKISKSNEIIISLPIINKMFIDDLALNIITKARNHELGYFFIRIFLTFFNRSLYIIFYNVSFYILMCYFVKSIASSFVVTDIDTPGFITSLYIFLRVVDSMFMLPHAFKRFTTMYVSYNRVKKYTNECSPNYYISNNKFTGSINMEYKINKITNQINKDVVVLYKDASFSWIYNRKDVIDMDFDYYLENINFELKRGEIAIITGSQGSGKSNFIKSVLGEMTLVGGSMAVVPLHTSMPIFYASQDIWLKKGTVRSNILFGYKYDEAIYDAVVKAVELRSDILSWEYGDMRVVYDNGYCLSGGQRVRMEMARAIYAYMIFSQVNRQYNNCKCSFLMCLDSPFHGLDPFVSKTIFNNLFNSKSGLLVNDDLSVILSSSKRSLDICVGSSDLKNYPNIPIYHVSNLTMSLYRNLHSYLDSNQPEPDSNLVVPHNFESRGVISSVNSLVSGFSSYEMNNKCLDWSGTVTRHKLTVNKYDRSESSNSLKSCSGFRPYVTYFSAATISFILFIVLMFAATIMDNLRFVFASELSDYIKDRMSKATSPEEVMNRFSDIKTYSDKTLKSITIFTVCVILVCLAGTVFLSASCIVSSRKIHEYCINSIFFNSSSVIKIKKQISQLITYLTSDIFQIDESVGYAMSVALVSLVESLIHFLTICYLMPYSIPVIVIVVFIIVKFVFIRYVNSSKNLQIASLESTSQINAVCEEAISGSSIYRCFKKEGEFMSNIIEHTDYYMRCLFLNKSILAKSTILCKVLFSMMNLIFIIPLFRREYYNVRVNGGVYGLAVSMAMIVSSTFTNFMVSFARLEVLMCSMKRFENFVPPGTKFRFLKKKNVREEELVVKYSEAVSSEEQADMAKNQLHKRREAEYLNDATCCPPISKMFKKPKILKLDVSKYIQPRHFSVQIKNLYVAASDSPEMKKFILRGINSSASASNIIGIIGRTGSGKTTLLSVIQNTSKNRTGQVLLDGKDLNDLPKDLLTQVIGVLPQLPFVFKGWTVRRFLDPRKLFSDDEINEALDNCGLLEFVNRLPGYQKLDTVIIQEEFEFITKRKKKEIPKTDNRMSKYRKSLTAADLKNYYADSDMILSSSQLRTLSFARLVLYRKFYRVILVDEPPSENCEEEGDDKPNFVAQDVGIPIYELLQKYFSHCTTFLTAHDANALVMCTSVWVMHDGQLIRTCTRDEIKANESISNIIEESVRRKRLSN